MHKTHPARCAPPTRLRFFPFFRPASILLLAAGLAAAGCSSLRTNRSQSQLPQEQAEVEQRLHEVLLAAKNKDFDRLDSYHLYGPKFSKFVSSSPDRLDAAAGRKGEHDGLGAAKDLQMRADGLKVDLFGNMAIATFILDYSFDSAGGTVHRKERSTLVFVKDANEWKIAHEHLSRIEP